MSDWRILVIDDDKDIGVQVKEILEAETLGKPATNCVVETETDFDRGIELLDVHRIDFVVLDVQGVEKDSEKEIGIATLERIKASRFVPVIFYTAFPAKVKDLETALVRVVVKTDGAKAVFEEIKNIFELGVPNLHRAIIKHVENQQRNYMWNFVANNIDVFGKTDDKASLAFMLARRLALSLSGSGIEQFISELGDTSGAAVTDNKIHPMQYYVFPPLEKPSELAGDIYKKNGTGEYYILLTPSCDLVQKKAEWLLFAKCLPLEEMEEYNEWSKDRTKSKKLSALLRNNRETQPKRYFLLPAALNIPNLIVDLQQLQTIPKTDLEGEGQKYHRVVSLDSPFAEALLGQFSQLFGRLGTPDLNIEYIISKLSAK